MSETVKPFTGITVTLTTHAVAYNLYSLLKAIDPLCPPVARECSIQFDGQQTGAAGQLFIGDESVSSGTQRCGVSLSPGDSKTYGAGAQMFQVYLSNIWLLSTSLDACLVNIEVQC